MSAEETDAATDVDRPGRACTAICFRVFARQQLLHLRPSAPCPEPDFSFTFFQIERDPYRPRPPSFSDDRAVLCGGREIVSLSQGDGVKNGKVLPTSEKRNAPGWPNVADHIDHLRTRNEDLISGVGQVSCAADSQSRLACTGEDLWMVRIVPMRDTDCGSLGPHSFPPAAEIASYRGVRTKQRKGPRRPDFSQHGDSLGSEVCVHDRDTGSLHNTAGEERMLD